MRIDYLRTVTCLLPLETPPIVRLRGTNSFPPSFTGPKYRRNACTYQAESQNGNCCPESSLKSAGQPDPADGMSTKCPIAQRRHSWQPTPLHAPTSSSLWSTSSPPSGWRRRRPASAPRPTSTACGRWAPRFSQCLYQQPGLHAHPRHARHRPHHARATACWRTATSSIPRLPTFMQALQQGGWRTGRAWARCTSIPHFARHVARLSPLWLRRDAHHRGRARRRVARLGGARASRAL